VGLVANPVVFGLFLLANLGIYTAGVLLIREARVRWHLGWASVLTLGVAYGIAEEGLALDTLFDLHAGPVTVATAVHVFGVNWGWASQILVFHALFSVALPILFLDLALPETRGRTLLTDRGLRWTVAAYLATIGVIGVVLARFMYWMGAPVLIGSLLVIGGLVLLARGLPYDALAPRRGLPSRSPRWFFLLGLTAFPLIILVPVVLTDVGIPLAIFLYLAPALGTSLLVVLLRHLGTIRTEPSIVAFAAGAVLPIIGFGFVFALRYPLGLPVVVVVDLLAILFFARLYGRSVGRNAAPGPAGRPVPG
jgi:hypothetical protein